MKKFYSTPEMVIVEMNASDVIATSSDVIERGQDPTPNIKGGDGAQRGNAIWD